MSDVPHVRIQGFSRAEPATRDVVGTITAIALIDATQVIEDAIDGHDVPIAERAVSSCIQLYFRD